MQHCISSRRNDRVDLRALSGRLAVRHGEYFVTTESSNVLYCNSILGARGYGGGGNTTFCAAICGRAPKWGLHLPENRHGTHVFHVACDARDKTDWDLLGAAVGRLAPNAVPVICGDFERPDLIKLKTFFTALVVTSGCVLRMINVAKGTESTSLPSFKQRNYSGNECDCPIYYGFQIGRFTTAITSGSTASAVQWKFWCRPAINKRKGRTTMEFKKEKVYTPLVAPPTHNVSQAIKYGDLVFVSGMVGEDENEVLKEGLEAQCEQAFLNMKNVLEAAGSGLEKVLFCQIFIGKREDRAIANQVWDRFFLNMDVGPARYTVVAPTVAEPYLFEITCIAGV